MWGGLDAPEVEAVLAQLVPGNMMVVVCSPLRDGKVDTLRAQGTGHMAPSGHRAVQAQRCQHGRGHGMGCQHGRAVCEHNKSCHAGCAVLGVLSRACHAGVSQGADFH